MHQKWWNMLLSTQNLTAFRSTLTRKTQSNEFVHPTQHWCFLSLQTFISLKVLLHISHLLGIRWERCFVKKQSWDVKTVSPAGARICTLASSCLFFCWGSCWMLQFQPGFSCWVAYHIWLHTSPEKFAIYLGTSRFSEFKTSPNHYSTTAILDNGYHGVFVSKMWRWLCFVLAQ